MTRRIFSISACAFARSSAVIALIAATCAPSQTSSAPIEQFWKLTASDGAARDYFGTSVSVSGHMAIVGAPLNDRNAVNAGAAYVFDLTSGQQIFRLAPHDIEPDAWFGESVAISGNLAIVGAPHGDSTIEDSGAAYLYNLTTGEQIAKLVSTTPHRFDGFGYSVAMSGTTAIVGAYGEGIAGASYLFDAVTGQLLHRLTASDGTTADYFGYSVSIDGDTALIGAPNDNDEPPVGDVVIQDYDCDDPEVFCGGPGSMYIFDVSSGAELKKIFVGTAAPAEYDRSVAVGDGYVVLGSPIDYDYNSGMAPGAVYIFDLETGRLLSQLFGSNHFDQFGQSVATDAGMVLVGSPWSDRAGSRLGPSFPFRCGHRHSIGESRSLRCC